MINLRIYYDSSLEQNSLQLYFSKPGVTCVILGYNYSLARREIGYLEEYCATGPVSEGTVL